MIRCLVTASILLGLCGAAVAQPDAERIYRDNCASCHGADRLGGTGPALIPETLSRLRGDALTTTISQGRTQTQMPAFSETLSKDDIAALTAYLQRPVEPAASLDR